MTTRIRTAGFRFAGCLLLGLLPAAGARAQYRDDDPRQYRGGEIRQTVARISYLAGPVSYARGDEPDNWQPPDLNVPMTLGDRLYTGRGGRAELQIHGGALVRLDAGTELAALNLTDDTKQLSLNSGAAAFQLRRLGPDEVFEVDTPNAAVTLERIGDYRIDVDRDGNTRVGVRRGRAMVAAGGGQVALSAGDEMDIDGIDEPRYDIVALARADGFDRWVSDREKRVEAARSRAYVSEDIVGVADLDDHGRWEDIPEYGHSWSPASVEAGWAPYRDGHWVWQDPWGWTWVSAEPWGWAPYHYGRWVTYSSRWYWVPVGPRATTRYAPALVAFVGGGPAFSASARVGGDGFVGWFPLAPRDPFIPWWGSRTNANVANVRYVNRTFVTVVNQNTFVSGGFVSRNVVTDRTILRDVVSAPVLRGPLPVVPTAASLRVAVRPELQAPPRPPAAIVERPVVARLAPPPPPPAFSSKVEVIRENRGAPVGADVASRIVQQRAPARVLSVRPVISEPGRVTLAPARATSGSQAAPQPVPVAPQRGRVLATQERPFASPAGAVAPANAVPAARENASPAAPAPPRPSDRERPNERVREPLNRQAAPVAPAAPQVERAPAATPAPPSDRPRPSNEDWRNRQARPAQPGPERNVEAPAPAPAPTSPPGNDNSPRQRDLRRERPAESPASPSPDRGRAREIRPAETPAPPSPPDRGRAREAAPAPPSAPAPNPNAPPNREVQRQRPDDRERPAPPAPEKARSEPQPPAAAPPAAAPNRERPAPEARGEQKEKPKKDQKKDEKKDQKKDQKKDDEKKDEKKD